MSPSGFGRDTTEETVGAAMEVHRYLEPCLLESTYGICLAERFALIGLRHEKEVSLPTEYKGVKLETSYRMDFVVSDLVVMELKSIAAAVPVHRAQMMTYLRMARKSVGLLLNFNVPLLKDGIERFSLKKSLCPLCLCGALFSR
jgi:GxxExxY protein